MNEQVINELASIPNLASWFENIQSWEILDICIFWQNTRCKRQAQFLQLLQNLQSSLRWSQTWGWKLFNLESTFWQCLHNYFNWYENITSSLIQIAIGILGHCVEVRFDEQRCLETTNYSSRTISTFCHIYNFEWFSKTTFIRYQLIYSWSMISTLLCNISF